VDRPRLVESLSDPAHRVSVVRAPAGWGKTTLIAAWARSENERRRFPGSRAARDLIERAVGKPFRGAGDCVELEPGVFERGDGLGEPRFREFDRMALQVDVGAECGTTASP